MRIIIIIRVLNRVNAQSVFSLRARNKQIPNIGEIGVGEVLCNIPFLDRNFIVHVNFIHGRKQGADAFFLVKASMKYSSSSTPAWELPELILA